MRACSGILRAMEITDDELELIMVAADAVEDYGEPPEVIPYRVDPGRGAFVTLTSDQARRLVAAARRGRR